MLGKLRDISRALGAGGTPAPNARAVAAAAAVAALLVFTAHAAFAQDARQRAARARSVRSAMNQAVALLRSDPRQAIESIKALARQYPEEKQFLLEKLGYAYTVASMPDSALAAYEACVALEPLQLSAARELAQLYITRGDTAKAERIFSDMLRRTPNRMQAYRAVSQAQAAVGWNEQALETCHRARAELNSPDAFALDIGDLERMAGNTERALDEYLLYLGNKQADLQTGQQKIRELSQDPKADKDAFIAKLEAHSRSGAEDYRQRVLEILSQTYLEANLLENALDAGLAADGLAASNGGQLYELIRRLCGRYENDGAAEKARFMDLCLRASDAYLLRHPKTAEAPAVHLVRSSMLLEKAAGRRPALAPEEQAAALAAAVEGLDFVIAHYPGTRFAERAALMKGDVFLRRADKEEALRIYRRGMQGAVEYPAEFAKNVARTLCALGQYDEGIRHCSALMRSKNATLADTGAYYMGLTLVCTGAYEAARDTLAALAEHRPASEYTNDAIDLAWVIELGLRLDPEHLDAYGSVLKSELAGDSAAVFRGLEAFAGMPAGTPLRPRALYKLGLLHAETGEHEKALSTFSRFLEEYPEDALAPEAERRMGGVYEHGLGDREQALKRYEHVLMVYPGYVFLDEVRRDVVRLREPARVE